MRTIIYHQTWTNAHPNPHHLSPSKLSHPRRLRGYTTIDEVEDTEQVLWAGTILTSPPLFVSKDYLQTTPDFLPLQGQTYYADFPSNSILYE